MKLNDSFKAAGTDLATFEALTKDIDASTSIEKYKKMWNFRFLSINTSISEEELASQTGKDPEYFKSRIMVYDLSPEAIENFTKKRQPLKIATIKKSEFCENPEDDTLIKEAVQSNQAIMLYDETKYLISQLAFSSLLKKASIKSTSTRKNGSLIRNMYLAEVCSNRVNSRNDNCKVCFLTRSDGTAKKIFCFVSPHFKLAKHTYVAELAKKNGTLKKWSIDQTFTTAFIDFEDKSFTIGGEVITPGVIVRASDLDTMYRISLSCRVGNSYAIYDEDVFYHDSPEELELSVLQKKIDSFKKKIPMIKKAYGDLVSYKIEADSDEEMFNKVSRGIEFLIDNVDVCGFLPKKRRVSLSEMLISEIESGKTYTVADLMALMITVPCRQEDLHETQIRQLQIGIGTSVFNDSITYKLKELA